MYFDTEENLLLIPNNLLRSSEAKGTKVKKLFFTVQGTTFGFNSSQE